jgi:hypothetical protein
MKLSSIITGAALAASSAVAADLDPIVIKVRHAAYTKAI